MDVFQVTLTQVTWNPIQFQGINITLVRQMNQKIATYFYENRGW